jgi:hypothetical protein
VILRGRPMDMLCRAAVQSGVRQELSALTISHIRYNANVVLYTGNACYTPFSLNFCRSRYLAA